LERRLAAILAADVVGYTRLMGEDETGTLERLKSLRRELVQPKITERKGRIVKLMGDGLLAEFPSVVEAVQFAVDLQEQMVSREADLPDEQRIRLRIGVNLGDIIVEGSDIYGDGVNVAARLETLADPGGICISGTVFDHVKGKVSLGFEDLGEQKVKNIDQPVPVYRISLHGRVDPIEATSSPLLSAPVFELPDKPSIAVLPFNNMSGDPEQEYFSDGITEDIITELARFNSLFVIARNSPFHYKGQSPKIQDVGRELGVQYVVEGSVRTSGSRVRVTAQLIEAATGNHLWAERYDRNLEDIFAVQDEIVREIATAVPGQLDAANIQRVQRRSTDNLTAYEYLMRAIHLRHRDWGSRDAAVLLEKAAATDAHCALAHAHLANWHAYSILAHCAPAEEARRLTMTLAEKAIRLDPNDATILSAIAEAYTMSGDLELARQCIERAIKLNPNNYVVMSFAVGTFAYLGDIDEALRWNEKTIRYDPISSEAFRESSLETYYMAGCYEDAIMCFTGWNNPPRHVVAEAAAAYAQAGRHSEAIELRERYEARLPPDYTFAEFLAAQMQMCALQDHREMWLEGYRKAGFDVS
jgi:adenylate cyclase